MHLQWNNSKLKLSQDKKKRKFSSTNTEYVSKRKEQLLNFVNVFNNWN